MLKVLVRSADRGQRAAARIDDVELRLVRMLAGARCHYLVAMSGAELHAEAPLSKLSLAQERVACLAVQGRTVADIAAALGISVNTVKFHLKSVYALLGVRNRVELTETLPAVR
jgi:DNA-binding CsgD family transcriptional regulator